MLGGKNKQLHGYTIVEVMIVLAISGFMFVIAASFISGKQERASFTQGVNTMASRIQDTIEQVADGRYSDVPFTCSSGGGGLSFASAFVAKQGTNDNCVFIGKFLHFSVGGKQDQYETFSLGGNRLTNMGLPPSSMQQVNPTPIKGTNIDLTTQQEMPQDLDVTQVTVNGIKVWGFGLLQSIGQAQPAPFTGYFSGAQDVGLYYSPILTNAADPNPEATIAGPPNTLVPTDQATMCVTDSKRWATIKVGANHNQLQIGVLQYGLNDPGPPAGCP